MQSCIFAWEIPWTEEPGRLWSMGLQSQKGLSDWITTTRKVHNGFIRVTLTSSPTPIHCILSLLPLHHGQLGGSLSSSFIWGLALCLQTLFIFIQYHAAHSFFDSSITPALLNSIFDQYHIHSLFINSGIHGDYSTDRLCNNNLFGRNLSVIILI